jgi:DNA/RNA-binding domain of Phe-tRNA-synthetase-like protein
MRHISQISTDRLLAGIVEARNIEIARRPDILYKLLDEILVERNKDLGNSEEAFRQASRDMLRNGSYKPTGRAKPASEYLLRAAMEGTFPRINTAVDINNYISLKYMVPISLWDADKAGGRPLFIDLGREGEKYVFNEGGQEIDVKDLVCGFLHTGDGGRIPVINPVKDSMLTKTDPGSRNIGYVVYYPAGIGTREHLQGILTEMAALVRGITEGEVTTGIAEFSGA